MEEEEGEKKEVTSASIPTPMHIPIPVQSTNRQFKQKHHNTDQSSIPPNLSNWYEPSIGNDILIEQRRHAISFLPHCPNCKSIHYEQKYNPPLIRQPTTNSISSFGSLCNLCLQNTLSSRHPNKQYVSESTLSFPLAMLMRPTLWRFHGQGNDVRRGVWLMDTQRHGLQPYSNESAAVLEDAYLFLKWTKSREEKGIKIEGRGGIDSVILTVQVIGPDGDETQLVQFRSLRQVTAIQKTIAGGFSLFKRRVYRGAQINNDNNEEDDEDKDTFEKKETEDDKDDSTEQYQQLLAAPLSLHGTLTNPSPRIEQPIDDPSFEMKVSLIQLQLNQHLFKKTHIVVTFSIIIHFSRYKRVN